MVSFSLKALLFVCLVLLPKNGMPFLFGSSKSSEELTVCVPEGDYCAWNGEDICEEEDNYNGTKSTTREGVVCLRWDATDDKTYGKRYPGHNYCRNPDEEEDGPWCFTSMDEDDQELCFEDCDDIYTTTTTQEPEDD